MIAIDVPTLQPLLARHLPLYRVRPPRYQAAMLNALRDVWSGPHDSLLDVGAGTGVIAAAVHALFPAGEVEAVDVVDRFCPGLPIPVARFDGRTLPYADGAFEAAMLNNVVHHVPVAARAGLLREIRRVVRGPLYVKDHERRGPVDGLRLAILDAVGNVPFGGMVRAHYLAPADWDALAEASGYAVAARAGGRYRSGLARVLFPDGLETTMRLEPVAA